MQNSINDAKTKLTPFFLDRFVSKKLTKDSHLEALFFICKQPGLTSTQIVDALPGSQYTYLVLEELNPPQTKQTRIFVWEDIQSSEQALKLYNLINNIENFGNPIPYSATEIIDFSRPTANQIIISYQSWKMVFDKVQDKVILTILENERICHRTYLITKSIKSKCHVYLEFSFIIPLFNYVKTKEREGKKLFYLNGLGFLLLVTYDLYLKQLGEILSHKEVFQELPFLKNWKKLEKFGFRVSDELGKVGKLYEVEIKKCDNLNLLLFKINEYYCNQISAYFGSLQFFAILKTNQNLMFEYQQMIGEKFLDNFFAKMRKQQRTLLRREIKRLSIMHDPPIEFVSGFPIPEESLWQS